MLTTGSCLFTELTKLKPFNQKKTSDVFETSDVWKTQVVTKPLLKIKSSKDVNNWQLPLHGINKAETL